MNPAELLPQVYDELRKLAAAKLASEKPGQTLDATALVHEAYIRLVGTNGECPFANRHHFFAAAAEAMRRILIDSARRKLAQKRGTNPRKVELDLDRLASPGDEAGEWIDLDEALLAFASVDAEAAELAKLRIFAGLSVEEAAQALGIARATGFRAWTYARAWLSAALSEKSGSP
jgi:RNA polymerase sigma factor (TIGR02999 family)